MAAVQHVAAWLVHQARTKMQLGHQTVKIVRRVNLSSTQGKLSASSAALASMLKAWVQHYAQTAHVENSHQSLLSQLAVTAIRVHMLSEAILHVLIVHLDTFHPLLEHARAVHALQGCLLKVMEALLALPVLLASFKVRLRP